MHTWLWEEVRVPREDPHLWGHANSTQKKKTSGAFKSRTFPLWGHSTKIAINRLCRYGQSLDIVSVAVPGIAGLHRAGMVRQHSDSCWKYLQQCGLQLFCCCCFICPFFPISVRCAIFSAPLYKTWGAAVARSYAPETAAWKVALSS